MVEAISSDEEAHFKRLFRKLITPWLYLSAIILNANKEEREGNQHGGVAKNFTAFKHGRSYKPCWQSRASWR